MTNKNEILDYWPMDYKPRKTQLEAFSWLAANRDAPYLILEAPTGFGKSVVGITLSRYLAPQFGSSFILTPQIILQHQYEETFKDIPEINFTSFYGKSNYKCETKHTSCDAGVDLKPKCYSCPYQHAREQARKTLNTVMNYKCALTNFVYTDIFVTKHKRKLIISDECHNLEEQLIDVDTLQISEYRCDRYNVPFVIPKTSREAVDWIKESYVPKIKLAVFRLGDQVQETIDSGKETYSSHEIHQIKELNQLRSYLRDLESFLFNTPEQVQNNFVLVSEKISFSFKRLYGAHTFEAILQPFGHQMLFMSSTILNKQGFCSDLGINANDAVMLSSKSEFPIENRPVVYIPHMKMNIDWKKPENKKQREKMIDTIKKLLIGHQDESGIIHTANFQIATWLVEELTDNISHQIYHHNPNSNDKRVNVISQYLTDQAPSVLISPSITEGLDLKEELGRFAIIVKTPFGNLGDAWIKRRMDLSKEWYQRQALISVIQGGGRIVRSSTDKGNVYILDGSFMFLYNQTKYMIPKWWNDAFEII